MSCSGGGLSGGLLAQDLRAHQKGPGDYNGEGQRSGKLHVKGCRPVASTPMPRGTANKKGFPKRMGGRKELQKWGDVRAGTEHDEALTRAKTSPKGC